MENNNTDLNPTEGEPNISEQSTRMTNSQTTSERAQISKYKIPILSYRDTDLKDQSQIVVGAKIGVYSFDI